MLRRKPPMNAVQTHYIMLEHEGEEWVAKPWPVLLSNGITIGFSWTQQCEHLQRHMCACIGISYTLIGFWLHRPSLLHSAGLCLVIIQASAAFGTLNPILVVMHGRLHAVLQTAASCCSACWCAWLGSYLMYVQACMQHSQGFSPGLLLQARQTRLVCQCGMA